MTNNIAWLKLHALLTAAELKPRLCDSAGIYWIEIHTPRIAILIQRRPEYCDRGRWHVLAESTAPHELTIDFADGFPRYYFGDGALVSELVAFLNARDEEVIP